MADTKWMIKGREFVNCNCSYGCPCQFDGLPTHGYCQAVGGFQIDQGYHGSTKLDDLKFVGIFRWPGAIHEGKGEAAVIIDERATEAQRGVLLRILTGQDTEPGATVFTYSPRRSKSYTIRSSLRSSFKLILQSGKPDWLCQALRKAAASRSLIP